MQIYIYMQIYISYANMHPTCEYCLFHHVVCLCDNVVSVFKTTDNLGYWKVQNDSNSGIKRKPNDCVVHRDTLHSLEAQLRHTRVLDLCGTGGHPTHGVWTTYNTTWSFYFLLMQIPLHSCNPWERSSQDALQECQTATKYECFHIKLMCT